MTSLLVTTNPTQPYSAPMFYAVAPMFYAVGREKNGPKRKNTDETLRISLFTFNYQYK